MDFAFRDEVFRACIEGHSEQNRCSRALLLGATGLFWISVLSALAILPAGGAEGLSPLAAAVRTAALPAGFVLGRCHARTLLRNL